MENYKINQKHLAEASEILRALTHPLRLSIMTFIDKNKEINVNKIYKKLGLEQSITSQHLKVLRKTGIVKTARQGKFIFYSLDYERIAKIMSSLNNFVDKKQDKKVNLQA